MIQPLRTLHRRAFIILAGVLPLILSAGLIERHRVPAAKSRPLTTDPRITGLHQTTVVSAKNTFEAKLASAPVDSGLVHFALVPLRELHEPDLLLYWTSPAAQPGDLTSAHLLGAFTPEKSYLLPAGTGQGSLVLFSLAHGEIVDTARIEGLR